METRFLFFVVLLIIAVCLSFYLGAYSGIAPEITEPEVTTTTEGKEEEEEEAEPKYLIDISGKNLVFLAPQNVLSSNSKSILSDFINEAVEELKGWEPTILISVTNNSKNAAQTQKIATLIRQGLAAKNIRAKTIKLLDENRVSDCMTEDDYQLQQVFARNIVNWPVLILAESDRLAAGAELAWLQSRFGQPQEWFEETCRRRKVRPYLVSADWCDQQCSIGAINKDDEICKREN